MIAVRSLSKSFGSTQVLESVSFELEPGTLTALVGGNGAGKSTLLKIMSGAIRADGGEVLAGPASPILTVADAIRNGVRTSYQESSLIPAWTVGEHFPPWPSSVGPPWSELAPNIESSSYVEGLDQAEHQSIEVARALAGDPAVVLADEPTAGLDARLRTIIVDALKRATAAGAAVLWVTHDLEGALGAASRILVLRGGRLVRDAPSRGLSVAELVEDFTSPDDHTGTTGREADAEPPATGPTPWELFGLQLRAGEVLGLVGRGTAGISAAMRSAAGLPELRARYSRHHKMPGARVRYMSRERATEWDFDGQDVGFNLTVGIIGGLSSLGLRNIRKESESAHALSDRFNVSAPSLNASIDELSGGNRQKVVLARMAACEPDVLLLDEPFSGVDAPTREKLAEQLRTLARSGAAVVIYSQEIHDLLLSCDRLVAVRDDGKPIEIEDRSNAEAAIERCLAGIPASAGKVLQ